MQIVQRNSTDYQKQATDKDTIVLHYTAGGTASGAIATLNIRDYVNVHYILDRDGTVYQMFDERFWAYHTGSGKVNDKRSIGIEIVNWGHLDRFHNALFSWTGKKIPWDQVELCGEFRGYRYWQKLTNEQIATLPLLIANIESRHNIKRIITHAELNPRKLDFPPDYPVIRELIKR